MNPRFKYVNSRIVAINLDHLNFRILFWSDLPGNKNPILRSSTIPNFRYDKTLLVTKESESYYNTKRIPANSFFFSFLEKLFLGIRGTKMDNPYDTKTDNLFSFSTPKLSWRFCNAYSQTLRLHSSDILCFSLHFWIPI